MGQSAQSAVCVKETKMDARRIQTDRANLEVAVESIVPFPYASIDGSLQESPALCARSATAPSKTPLKTVPMIPSSRGPASLNRKNAG